MSLARRIAAPLLLASAVLILAQSSTESAHVEKEKIKSLRLGYSQSKRAMTKAKSAAAPKIAFANTAAAYGTAIMNATSYTDRAKKYRDALHLFREALKADPTNKEAKENKDLIEGIYKQLGKKIPD